MVLEHDQGRLDGEVVWQTVGFAERELFGSSATVKLNLMNLEGFASYHAVEHDGVIEKHRPPAAIKPGERDTGGVEDAPNVPDGSGESFGGEFGWSEPIMRQSHCVSVWFKIVIFQTLLPEAAADPLTRLFPVDCKQFQI
jgi:hypothetical protein